MILGTVLTVLVGLTGFHVTFLQTDSVTPNTPVDTEKKLNVTANSDNPIQTANFYNQSIDLMYEDRKEAKVYLDYDKDGSFDYQLDINSDGEYHETSRTILLDSTSYALYFRYIDYSNRTDDGEITLYKVKRP